MSPTATTAANPDRDTAAGADIAVELVLPLLLPALTAMTQEERVRTWAGLMAALSGQMIATIGGPITGVLLRRIHTLAQDIARNADAGGGAAALH